MEDKWQKLKKLKGRPKKMPSPQILLSLAYDYFSHVDANPWMMVEQKKGNTSIPRGMTTAQIKLMVKSNVVELPHARPYTWAGLDNYIFEHGYTVSLKDYRGNKDDRYSEFTEVIARIDQIMFDQKFSGASVGAFNHNIISRDLGLIDRSQTTLVTEQPLFPDVPADDCD